MWHGYRQDALIAVFCIFVFMAILLGLGHRVHSQDHSAGHTQFHAAYSEWAQPGMGPGTCCNAKVYHADGSSEGDCYPTSFELVAGHWRAQRDDGVWVEIPDGRIIHEHNPDQSGVTGHLCYNYGTVLCAVPPTGTF